MKRESVTCHFIPSFEVRTCLGSTAGNDNTKRIELYNGVVKIVTVILHNSPNISSSYRPYSINAISHLTLCKQLPMTFK